MASTVSIPPVSRVRAARVFALHVALAVAAVLAVPSRADAQRLVLLVRHAERADGGMPPPGMTTPADPDLSAEGKARADRLATMLADAGITRIIVTEYRRTVQTAEPIAKRLGLTPERVMAADTAAVAARLKTYTDDIVLVVGHSNSTPALIEALGGPKVSIAETDYGSLFVFVPATGALSRLRF
jgi:broad specificity phosphatase PhoE